MVAPDFRQLFEAAPALYTVLDRAFHIVAASDAYLSATMTRRGEVIGRSIFEVFPAGPADPDGNGPAAIREVFERALTEETPQMLGLQRYDMRRPAERGGAFERRYWNAWVTPLRGRGGAVEHLLCSVEDVTDRARDARLRKVLNIDSIGVVFFDKEGTLISANDAFLRWSGYTEEEIAAEGLSWKSFTPPEYYASSLDEVERLRTTGQIGPYEKEYIAKNGERRWMLFVGAALDDGTIVEYVIDVSARKAAEEARRESDERYRRLFDSIDVGFCVIEMIYDGARPVDYRFLEVNPAFERQTGLHDPGSRTMREHVPEHEQHWFDTYGRVAATGEPTRFVAEARALMGGSYEVFAFRVGGAGSRKVGVLFNDITARVRAEEALREASQRKDEFVATLAHELRNPLAPIRNAVSMLRLREDGDEGLQAVRKLIDRQVRHLVRLVDDLLDVSRITFGKVSVKRERLDLRAVAQEAVATSEPLLAVGGHRFSAELGGEPVWVDGDPVRLAQVIANLINNAVRYTPPSRVSSPIRLSVAAKGAEACITVEDNGIGIEPALLERIFEPFVQIERGEAGSSGIGIGLMLAKALVELHGGRIVAESEGLGKGSRFVGCLPRAEAPEVPEAAAPTGAPVRAASRRFLVVDDNVDATTSQAELLRMLGHEVETAYDGQSALRKAQAFRPEVVLLDLGMPGMDGFEVARRLRAMPEGRDVLLVAQTGWGQEEERARTKAAGFDVHLAKPVDIDALMGLL